MRPMVVETEAPGCDSEPRREARAAGRVERAKPAKVGFPELLQDVRVPLHRLVLATTERPGDGEEKPRLAGDQRLPRRLANGGFLAVQEQTEFQRDGASASADHGEPARHASPA